VEIGTTYGPARAVIETPAGPPSFLLVLTHGAGGGVDAPDLLAVRDAGLPLGGTVVRVTQPYRVSGARAPGSAVRQDAAWLEIITALRDAAGQAAGAAPGERLPLVQGGRSNGARVACRTAAAAGAAAVIALAFPPHPPGRPDRSRAAELRIPGTKLLIVNGDRDPFGVPGRRAGARVVVLAGETHALSRDPQAAGRAVASWLPGVLGLDRAGTRKNARPAGR
jgi:predicted alpha/beta-hydrolase family hydrolase